MIFTLEDREKLNRIHEILETELNLPSEDKVELIEKSVDYYISRVNQRLEKLDLIPDVENFCENIRKLVEYETNNIKALNSMMTELKGIIAKNRAEIIDLCETKKGVQQIRSELSQDIDLAANRISDRLSRQMRKFMKDIAKVKKEKSEKKEKKKNT